MICDDRKHLEAEGKKGCAMERVDALESGPQPIFLLTKYKEEQAPLFPHAR